MVRAYRAMIRTVEIVVGALVLVLAVIVPVGVFFRYVLNNALSWTDEIGGLTLVWITYLGAVVALDRGTHLDMDLLSHKFPERWRVAARVVTDAALAALLLVVVWNGVSISSRLMGQTAISLPIPRGLLQSVMPLSGVLMLAVLAARWALPEATASARRTRRPRTAEAAAAEALATGATE